MALMLAKRGGSISPSACRGDRHSRNSCVHETEGQLILNGSYDIGFSHGSRLKDLGLCLNFEPEFGVPLELRLITNQTCVEAKAVYSGKADRR